MKKRRVHIGGVIVFILFFGFLNTGCNKKPKQETTVQGSLKEGENVTSEKLSENPKKIEQKEPKKPQEPLDFKLEKIYQEQSTGEVWVEIAIKNKGNKETPLSHGLGILGEEITQDLFSINSEGRTMKFKKIDSDSPGLRRYRRPSAPILLPAGETFRTKLRLDVAYEFLPGTHIYEIYYDGCNIVPGYEEQCFVSTGFKPIKIAMPTFYDMY